MFKIQKLELLDSSPSSFPEISPGFKFYTSVKHFSKTNSHAQFRNQLSAIDLDISHTE